MHTYHLTSVAAVCPVCAVQSGRLLWRATAAEAAQHFVLRERQPQRFEKLAAHIEALWGQPSCDVIRCDGCGFCYSHPYVAGDEAFYTLAYDRTGYPKWKWEFQTTYDALRAMQRDDLNLLEVGAGNGAFVSRVAADDIVPRQNIYCTEYSEYGRNQIGQLGIQCAAIDVRALDVNEFGRRFDVVCMFQVLEHLDRLDELFTQLRQITKDDGTVFLAVPNEHRVEFNELHGALLEMPPNHIGRWTQKSFEAIAARHGFELVEYQRERAKRAEVFRQFTDYRFLRQSQLSGSWANRAQGLKNRYLRVLAMQLVKAVSRLASLGFYFHDGLKEGGAQWVRLQKR